MDSLFSIVNIAKTGLLAEKARAEVFSSNIANVHNSQYVMKEVNFGKLLNAIESIENNANEPGVNSNSVIDSNAIVDEKPNSIINLDHEVAGLADAELRYQTIAQAIQKKMGLMDLIIGGKNR
jgi:flagellar basal-body rod protein FlgB